MEGSGLAERDGTGSGGSRVSAAKKRDRGCSIAISNTDINTDWSFKNYKD